MGVCCWLHASATLPLERGPSTHCIGGWLGPRTSLDVFVEDKNVLSLLLGLEHWIIQLLIRFFCSLLNSVFSGSYMMMNHGLLLNNELDGMWKDVLMAEVEALSWHLLGGTEQNCKKNCCSLSGPHWESRTFWICSRNACHLAVTLVSS